MDVPWDSFAVVAAMLAIYAAPGIVASQRNHRQAPAIWAITLLAGWTGIGWLGALVWALLRGPDAPPARAA